MAAETAAETATVGEEAEPLFSNLDIFLFSLIVGIVVYWFVFRKKPEPVPEFKKMESQWVSAVRYLHITVCGDKNGAFFSFIIDFAAIYLLEKLESPHLRTWVFGFLLISLS